MAALVVVESSWWQTLIGVAIGAVIGVASTFLVIRAENRRFNASETARTRARDVERIRSSLAAMAGLLSAFANVSLFELVDWGGETPQERYERLRTNYDDANARLLNSIGEVLIDPQFVVVENIFKEGLGIWHTYLERRQIPGWLRVDNPERETLVADIGRNSEDFSLAARKLIESLNQPAKV
jgi:hypothetical protein